MFKYELGQKAKDIITGFSGVIMARIEFLTGCNQYGISATTLTKDGKRGEWEYIDENRLVKMKGKITIKQTKEEEDNGCDGNVPSTK